VTSSRSLLWVYGKDCSNSNVHIDGQRKVDWHVIPQLLLIYMLSYIDRANVGNARLFGAEHDMGLSANDWNIGLTVFCASSRPTMDTR